MGSSSSELPRTRCFFSPFSSLLLLSFSCLSQTSTSDHELVEELTPDSWIALSSDSSVSSKFDRSDTRSNSSNSFNRTSSFKLLDQGWCITRWGCRLRELILCFSSCEKLLTRTRDRLLFLSLPILPCYFTESVHAGLYVEGISRRTISCSRSEEQSPSSDSRKNEVNLNLSRNHRFLFPQHDGTIELSRRRPQEFLTRFQQLALCFLHERCWIASSSGR